MARLRLLALYVTAAVLLSVLGLAVAERLVYRDRVLLGVHFAGV